MGWKKIVGNLLALIVLVSALTVLGCGGDDDDGGGGGGAVPPPPPEQTWRIRPSPLRMAQSSGLQARQSR